MQKNDYSDYLPPMLFGKALKERLTVMPDYQEEYREMDPGMRLLKLMDMYKIFIPQNMAMEIYHKLYMMTTMSFKQKGTIDSVQKLNENRRGKRKWGLGVTTGATSVTIIGSSGIGKTSCLQKAIELLGPVIEIEKPVQKIIPALLVSCPFDCSYKGLLCQILVCLDQELGTSYYEKSQKSTMNSQQILSMVCNLCQLHVGVLIVDEIQFIVQHKAGQQLYRMILQLINSAGIGVMMVGTPECLDFFDQAPQMARRMSGLQYQNLSYGDDFIELAASLFSLQYVAKKAELTEGLLSWLYEHSAGNPANLMCLIHDAQEIGIMTGTESLDISTLTMAYTERMKLLHGYIEPEKLKLKQTSTPVKKKMDLELYPATEYNVTIAEMVDQAKKVGKDVKDVFRRYFVIEEVLL